MQPGKFSSILWTIGSSLLHSGVVINDKEYAYGGHDKHGMTGVYWTKPKSEPPGGTFRCEVSLVIDPWAIRSFISSAKSSPEANSQQILHGFTLSPQNEIDSIIKEASEAFQGTSYNLLNKNCNHFTSYLCEKLTGRPGPSWLNRAASIGVALPCVVPKEWIAPPEYDTADGELLVEEDDEHDTHERSRMLRRESQERQRFQDDSDWDSENERRNGGSGKGKAPMRDTSGRIVPSAERAPLPRG